MRTRQRILAAATVAVVAIGMSLGGAGVAFADHGGPNGETPTPIAGVTLTDQNGLTCDGAGYQKPAAMDASTGVYAADWGSVSWNGASFSWTLVAGYDIDFCVKGASWVAGIDSSAFTGTTYDFTAQTGHGISHTGFRIVSTPQPEQVTPTAFATQYSCVDNAVSGGYITVDLSVPGVTYSIEDGSGNPVAFDGTTGRTAALPAGDYSVAGVDANADDLYTATPLDQSLTIDEFTEDCTELPTFPNWPASVTVVDESCVDYTVIDGTIDVVFPEGSEENPNPIRYFIDYEGENEQELTEESTVVPAGDYVVTAVVTDPNDSVNDSGTSAEFPVTVQGVDAEECDIEFPTFPNWPASVSTTDEVCGPFDVVSGSITVTFPTGSLENPTPVRYFIDYEGADEQELTEETTQVAAGSYVVTAVVTDPNDSVNDSGTSDEFTVVVAGQDADECGELETLAYTGASDLTGAFGLAALLITLTGMGMVVARRRAEV